jgi:hypothetical protein
MDALWTHTQTPVLHEKWDLRFSRIVYLPRALDTEPQRFRYTTRIAFGFEVSGEGDADGIRFLTRYDYRTRFGPFGLLFDRLFFRPLIGWATAWSFDRLRLWLEQRVDPAHAMRQTLVHFIARVALAAVFAYQGVVPKLLTRNVDEIAMLRDASVSAGITGVAVTALGILELAFAVVLLFVGTGGGRPTCVSGRCSGPPRRSG